MEVEIRADSHASATGILFAADERGRSWWSDVDRKQSSDSVGMRAQVEASRECAREG